MTDDLISRQAAIDAIFKSTEQYSGFMEMEMYTEFDAVNAVKSVPSAQRWIPVSERLPLEDHNVLITDEDGDIFIARYSDWSMVEDGGIEWWSHDFRVFPTAWMPLPEPYRAEGSEE